MSEIWNESGVPHGGFSAAILRGSGAGTAVATYNIETFTPNRPSKVTNRPGVLGDPNGWFAVSDQETGSGVLQIGSTTTETPQRGDWFEHVFDRKSGAAAERWVITSISDPVEMGAYAKCTFSAQKAALHTA